MTADHRQQARKFITWAADPDELEPHNTLDHQVLYALIGIGHALLAGPPTPTPPNIIHLSGTPTEAEIDQLRARLRDTNHPCCGGIHGHTFDCPNAGGPALRCQWTEPDRGQCLDHHGHAGGHQFAEQT